MNPFDHSILTALSSFAQRSYTFDIGVYLVSYQDVTKGAPVLALFFWAWFSGGEEDRRTLMSVLLGSILSVLFARALAATLPFRVRPLHAGLGFKQPFGLDPSLLKGWSSFPSDHACLFSALSIGLLVVDRPLGWAAAVYTVVFICLPRVYFGIHYPTDILAGIALGALFAAAFVRPRVADRVSAPFLACMRRKPGPFYAAFFIVTFCVATVFQGPIEVVKFVAGVARNAGHLATRAVAAR